MDASWFGQCKKISVSKDETIIAEGVYDKQKFTDFINELKMNLAEAKGDSEKEIIEKRIARLTGGIAVIYVGGATETEMKEKKDRVDDAVRATKAAIAEGYIVGGGTAFLRVPLPKDGVYLKGFSVVFEALEEPLNQISRNAGMIEADIYSKVSNAKGNFGYNAKTDTIEDLVLSGIIDPVKVLRCALQNAASSAGMILTSECLICDTL